MKPLTYINDIMAITRIGGEFFRGNIQYPNLNAARDAERDAREARSFTQETTPRHQLPVYAGSSNARANYPAAAGYRQEARESAYAGSSSGENSNSVPNGVSKIMRTRIKADGTKTFQISYEAQSSYFVNGRRLRKDFTVYSGRTDSQALAAAIIARNEFEASGNPPNYEVM